MVPNESTGTPYELAIPAGFPAPEIPEDNALTYERIALGKKLFFDPILSLDQTIACGSCHRIANAMADTAAFSVGIYGQLGIRNAPSLANVAYIQPFLRDGGTPTLETQVLAPLSDPLEMAFNIVEAAERLQQIPEYVQMSNAAYGRDPDHYVITRALAAFERTMISGNSKYDQVEYQGVAQFTASELNGMNIFFSDSTHCSECHAGFNFTDNSFRNNGLYEVYADTGRARITFDHDDYGKFRVPSLRNVGVTGPYMHDGSLETLEAVVEHYANGGQPNWNKSGLITGFMLNEGDKTDLVNFLRTLTDISFIENAEFETPP